MKLTVEISMYPFDQDYIPLIKGFIAELNKYDGLEVSTSATSTMVHGEYDHLMDSLKEMIAWSYKTHGRAVFVTKFIPGHELTD
jgi:uncharacterized protein YqgV (UPF0045/DUF77 family)